MWKIVLGTVLIARETILDRRVVFFWSGYQCYLKTEKKRILVGRRMNSN